MSLRRTGLQENLVRFCRELRKEGIKATITESLDASRALGKVDLLDRDEFYYALRTSLAKTREEIVIYDRVFDRFWKEFQEFVKESISRADREERNVEERLEPSTWSIEELEEGSRSEESQGQRPKVAISAYSPLERRGSRAFRMAEEVAGEAKRVIRRMKRRLATMPGRRTALSLKGEFDFRKTIRRNLTYGGEILYPVFRRRKMVRMKAVVLCDVSGSMDTYSEYLLKTLYHIRNTLHYSEVFVFSTDLVRLTEELVKGPLEEVASRISRMVEVWGSGTKIGYCINIFKERYGRIVDDRTILIIVSDGWDVGDINLLEESLKWARSRAAGIVWLNPLLDNPEYQVLTLGMKTALPYIDIFASASIFKNMKVFEKYFGKSLSPSFKPSIYLGPGAVVEPS